MSSAAPDLFCTRDEAIAAAVARSSRDGSDLVLHKDECKQRGADERTCTCIPTTLRFGARA